MVVSKNDQNKQHMRLQLEQLLNNDIGRLL